MKRLATFVVTGLVPAALGVSAIVYGAEDDAPGLVLLGILVIVGALAFGEGLARPSAPRLAGFALGALALFAITVGVAGWLENTF